MEKSDLDSRTNMSAASKRVAKRLLFIFENRFALALVEIQEEREKILRSLWLTMIASVCLLLAGIALTILILILFWGTHPIGALVILMAIYLAVAGLFYTRLARLKREWRTLPETAGQLRKDRECLAKILS